MNRDDAKKVLFILEDNYPSTYRNMITEQKIRQIDNYLEFFEEYDTPIIVVALKNYIKSNQYPPTIAGLQEQLDLITGKNDTDAELFALIEKACKNGYYGHKEEFEKLPKECQRWLGSSETLKSFAQMPEKDIASVVRGEFLKSIGQIKKSEIAQRSISPELKLIIEQAKYTALPEEIE